MANLKGQSPAESASLLTGPCISGWGPPVKRRLLRVVVLLSLLRVEFRDLEMRGDTKGLGGGQRSNGARQEKELGLGII